MDGMKHMKPTVGRIVHFYGDGELDLDPYAGIITRVRTVDDGWDICDIVTFGPQSMYHQQEVEFSPTPKAGCWSWPPREQ